MICDAPGCDKGMVGGTTSITGGYYRHPCERCGGTGIIHCCEGEREQPVGQDGPTGALEPR